MQLALLPTKTTKQKRPVLSVEKVPLNTSLGNRYFIVAKQGDRHWFYPLQFSELEARAFLSWVSNLDWTLNDSGIPSNLEKIHIAIEQLVDGQGIVGDPNWLESQSSKTSRGRPPTVV